MNNPSTPSDDAPNSDTLEDATACVVASPEYTEPKVIGPYTIHGLLGQGAMGKVYEASHVKLKRKVALKVLPPFFSHDPHRVARFTQEMTAAGRLDHPNVIRTTDAGEHSGCHYIAMEFIEGVDLQQIVDVDERMEIDLACEVIRQAAIGLQHVQENELVHRDIKPSNLMVTSNGVVKILDLGIARLRTDEQAGTLTSDGGLMGTPDFIAPEQVLNLGCVDVRADIYSLGCTLYRLLAGQAPFTGPDYGTHHAKVIGHTQNEPARIEEHASHLPGELADIIRKMMAKKPEDRFQTPGEVAEAMSPWAQYDGLPKLVARHLNQATAKLDVPVHPGYRSGQKTSSQNLDSATSRNESGSPKKTWLWPSVTAAAIVAAVCGLGSMFRSNETPTHDNYPNAQVTPIASSTGAPGYTPAVATSTETNPPTTETQPQPAILQLTDEQTETVTTLATTTQQLTTAVENIDRNTKNISDTLQDLRNSFASASKDGHIISNPKTQGEIYHNARTYTRQGKSVEARQSYLKLLRQGTPFVDVHNNFQSLLTVQEGRGRAREIYSSNANIDGPSSEETTTASAFAIANLHDTNTKRQLLMTLLQQRPKYAPAVYELSNTLTKSVLGAQTLGQREQELELLRELKKQNDEGQFLRHFLDQSEAATILENVEERITQLSAVPTNTTNPVRARFIRHNRGWTISIQVTEATEEIFYSVDGTTFQSTGESDHIDQRTGKVAPNSWFSLPAKRTPKAIHIKYTDTQGVERGPFEIAFDAKKVENKASKRILKLTKYSWVAFGTGSNHDNLYFTNLASHYESIALVEYGLNVDEPNKTHRLPNTKNGESDGLYLKIPEDMNYVVVRLTFRDGTKSEVVRIERD